MCKTGRTCSSQGVHHLFQPCAVSSCQPTHSTKENKWIFFGTFQKKEHSHSAPLGGATIIKIILPSINDTSVLVQVTWTNFSPNRLNKQTDETVIWPSESCFSWKKKVNGKLTRIKWATWITLKDLEIYKLLKGNWQLLWFHRSQDTVLEYAPNFGIMAETKIVYKLCVKDYKYRKWAG